MLPIILLGLMVGVIFVVSTVLVKTDNEKFWVSLLLIGASMCFSCALYEASLKDDCESNLPRNQTCKIVAVPEEVKSEP